VGWRVAHRGGQTIAQQHPIGHAGQRIVARHVLDLGQRLAVLGDVVVRRDPAAVGHRPVMNRDRAAVLQRAERVRWLVGDRDRIAPCQIRLAGHLRHAARRITVVHDLAQRGAGAHLFDRQPVHLGVALVAHDEPLLAVEEAQPLRHVVDGGVKAKPLGLVLGLLARQQCHQPLQRKTPQRQRQHRARDDRGSQPGCQGAVAG
jgi:hypothetical protein